MSLPDEWMTPLDLFHLYEDQAAQATRLELTAAPGADTARREADATRLRLTRALMDVDHLRHILTAPVSLASERSPARDDDYGQGAGQ